VSASPDFIQVLLNAGVLGAVVVMLYRLLTENIAELRDAVRENTRALGELIVAVRELKVAIDRMNGGERA
jgi:hypothetical protein